MQLLQLPVVQFKERFPQGVLVETRNGFPVAEGTIRFSRSARIYSDGFAKACWYVVCHGLMLGR